MAWEAALEALGQQLYYLRKSAGMTQAQAASHLGVSKSHLSNVEKGRDRPSTKIVAFYEEQFHGNGQAWGLYDALVTANRPPQRKSLDDAWPYPIPGDASTFVADITIPDGTVMPPYHKFEKIWRIRNSGTVPWIGRWLARVGAPRGHGIPASPYKVKIPDTQPGKEVDIKVKMQSQALAGSSQAHFKMVDDDEREYFPDRYALGLVLSIVVREERPVP
jgi:DNA-binding XRE family transcriptional regulator